MRYIVFRSMTNSFLFLGDFSVSCSIEIIIGFMSSKNKCLNSKVDSHNFVLFYMSLISLYIEIPIVIKQFLYHFL